MKKIEIKSIKELEDFAKKIISSLSPQKEKATILTLQGDLGSGKTAFTKAIAKNIGIKEDITSPTFVIEKIYKIKPENNEFFRNLIHIDAYRLNSGEELERINWEEIYNNPENLIIIEWPELVENILPKEQIRLKFKFIDKNIREISL